MRPQQSSQSPGEAVSGGRLRLTMLGGFELRARDSPVTLQPGPARLIAFLAVHHPRPLHRTYIASVLWEDAPERRAFAALRTALWRAKACDSDLVRSTATHVFLGPQVVVDVREMMSLARVVLDCDLGTTSDLVAIREATAPLLRAPDVLLPDWYDEWAAAERERYRQMRLHALEKLCTGLAAAGFHALAVEAGVAAVATEPLRESAHRALMTAHLEEGNAAEALREYRAFSLRLRAELGLSPSPQMRALAHRVVGRSPAAAVTGR